MPSGRRFTDPRHAALLESAKQLVVIIRRRALISGLPQRATTVAGYFMALRKLLRWMDEEAFGRFSDLDSTALLRFHGDIVQRKNRTGALVSPGTVQGFINLLVYLYRFRDELDDALSVDPCPGQTAGELAGVCRGRIHHGPHTPDSIALPLIQGAIDFLASSAFDILRAREIYSTAIAGAQRRGRSEVACNCTAVRALRKVTIPTPRGPQSNLSARDLSELLDMLYGACFVVISYLVGPRVSEIMHLKAGCVRSRVRDSSAASELVVMVGTIFKKEAGVSRSAPRVGRATRRHSRHLCPRSSLRSPPLADRSRRALVARVR